MIKVALYCLLSILVIAPMASQGKEEYEKRIKPQDFPTQASQLLKDSGLNIDRLKYYKEVDGDHRSFEAKFKYEGRRYSVEFDDQGILEDIEIDRKKRAIPKSTVQPITEYLNDTYVKWKIEKIQIQYPNDGNAEEVLNSALQMITDAPTNIELIVVTKSEGKLSWFEYLFSKEGILLNKRPVIRRSYDFLLF
ncbi:MAG: hypothetical protein AAFP76_01225 [Bacteroidota bacterium]